MKKLQILFALVVLTSLNAFSQITGLEKFENEYLKPLFPIAAGIVFIAGALINLGHFFGENRDIKKGIINILIFPGILLVIAGIYTGIRSITL